MNRALQVCMLLTLELILAAGERTSLRNTAAAVHLNIFSPFKLLSHPNEHFNQPEVQKLSFLPAVFTVGLFNHQTKLCAFSVMTVMFGGLRLVDTVDKTSTGKQVIKSRLAVVGSVFFTLWN